MDGRGFAYVKSAATYSPTAQCRSTIGAEGLDCWVRDGTRYTPLARATDFDFDRRQATAGYLLRGGSPQERVPHADHEANSNGCEWSERELGVNETISEGWIKPHGRLVRLG